MTTLRRVHRAIAALVVVGVLGSCTSGPSAVVPAPTFAPRVESAPADAGEQYAHDRLSTMSLEQKIMSMLMVHVPGVSPADRVDARLGDVGGFILMGDNIPEEVEQLAADTRALSPEVGLPVLVATDQEGGIVRRVPTDNAASAYQLRSQAPSATFDAFAQRGALLESVGVSVNFGIVADVASDPSSFIYERSFGATGADAGARVAEAVRGESMVLSTLKHFPGHGAAAGDSHSSIPATSLSFDEWQQTHAVPFVEGIAAGAPLIMFGHLTFSAVDAEPATFSTRWHEVLRNDLGFDGIVITDDMGMLERSGVAEYSDQITNAVRAIEAGNTMLLYVGAVDTAGIVAAVSQSVSDGDLDESIIDDAALRLLELRRELSGETGRFVRCLHECASIIR
ncbi:glycoside hydrolase family 3 N-terminal domain-containing protein [Rhodoglobus sp. NPDC076762]